MRLAHVGASRPGNTAAVRSPTFLLGILLTGAALVAFPAQDLPILFRDDVAKIAVSLVILAVASTVAAAGWARRDQGWRKGVGLPAAAAAALSAVAVAGYKVVGGIGWPTPRILLGPALVALAGAIGFGIGRGVGGKRRWTVTAVAVPVAVFAVAPGALIAVEVATPDFGPAPLEDCPVRQGVRYCALDGFKPLVDDWAFVVEAVRAQLPGDVARRLRRWPVVQHDEWTGAPSFTTLARPLTGWGRPGGGEGNAQAALGLGVAFIAVHRESGVAYAGPCGRPVEIEARDVVTWWLAGQVSRAAADQVRDTGAFADNVTGTDYADAPVPSVAASRYAAQLLDRPRAAVGRRLRAEWDHLAGPCTPAVELARRFDLDR